MKLVTGRTGEPHVTSEQDRMLNQGVYGEEACILQTGRRLNPEVKTSNEIRIRDGAIVCQGALGCVETNTYDSVTIQNGNQGMNRVDLIVWRYRYDQEQDKESADWAVVQGTPTEGEAQRPDYTKGNIQEGDAVVEFPVYEVKLEGINITEVNVIAKEMPTIDELNRKLDQESSTKVMGFSFLRRGNEVLMTHNSILEVVEAGHVYTNQGSIPMGYRPALDLSAIPGLITDGNNKIRGTWWLVANSTGSINVISSITHSDPLSYVTSASWPTSDVINL